MECTLTTHVPKIPIGIKAPMHGPVHMFHLCTKPKQMGEVGEAAEVGEDMVRRADTHILQYVGLGGWGRHLVCKLAVAQGGSRVKGREREGLWMGLGLGDAIPEHAARKKT